MGLILIGLLLYWLIILAERALVAIAPRDLEQLRAEERESSSAKRALGLSENPRPALAALLLTRVLLIVIMVVWATAWLLQQENWRALMQSGESGWLTGLGVLLLLALLLAILLEGSKKLGFRQVSEESATRLLRRLSGFILFWRRLFGVLVREKQHVGAALAEAHEAEDHPADSPNSNRDIDLLKSIVKFSDVTVKQVMQARSKVVAVDFRTGFQELLSTVREAGFSRLPVYDEDLDNVTGILYVKDLLPHLDKPDNFEWQSLIRTNVLLVPEAKKVSELLQEFKKKKLHLAVVVDEYGGSAGIVTMEDILEEVTGEIRDEFDEESEVRYRKLDEYNYAFEGQALLNDVCRITGLADDTFDEVRGTADTLAGLTLELRGDIPPAGEEIVWNGFILTVMAADNRRIEQLKLTLPRS